MFTLVLAASVALGATTPPPIAAQSCAGLLQLALPNASITTAQVVEAGAFTPATASSDPKAFADLPSFCRVAATLRPSSDSEIKIEVWLPITGWNGKFLAMGSGGWGGAIDYRGLAYALGRGYSTSATDDGHEGQGGAFVLGHPEKFIDFAYRSEHEMTIKAKAIIRSFYGRDPRYSYWDGCSGGGREGLLQAYRYPDEFDGVIAGDPATFRRNAWALWLANVSFKDPADYIPPAKYPMIHQAVLDACDKIDGLKDGLINDPTLCHFDPEVLQCKEGDAPSCLTTRQVQTARAILSPATTPSGTDLSPPGARHRVTLGSSGRRTGACRPFSRLLQVPGLQRSELGLENLRPGTGRRLSNEIDRNTVAMDPALTPFAHHGGKLLLYHGWADQQVAPGATVEFYDSILKVSGDSAPGWAAVVYGSRYGALRGRRRTRYVRQAKRDGAVGRAGQGARSDHRLA